MHRSSTGPSGASEIDHSQWMSRAHPLPDDLVDTAFTVSAARSLGVAPSRLRATDLDAPFHGVRVRADATSTLIDRCRAYLPLMSGSAHFSHETAALLYGIPLPKALERSTTLHVTVLAPQHPPQGRGIIGHRVAHSPIRQLVGLPLCSPEQAWWALACSLGHVDLVVAADHLLRRRNPLSTLERLHATIRSGARGAARARLALNEARPRTDSPMETRLRLLLVDHGLPEPSIGYTVVDADGFFVATPDLAYPVQRIAIEYEGSHHWTDARTFADDILRRELLEDAGWTVIRVIADHMRRPEMLANRIARILAAHGG